MPRICWLLVIFLTLCQTSFGQNLTQAFAEANELYENKQYDSAIQLYESILETGRESASIYFNLGNAYFKSGDLGHAVLYYLRAKRLAPADEDLNHNLEFARQFSRVRMEGVALNPVSDFVQTIVQPYRLETLAWAASIVFILLCLVLTVRYGLGFSNGAIRVATILLLVLVLITSGLTTYKYRTEFLTERAVVINDDSPVRSGPTEKAEIEFQGASGLVVEILSQSGEYYNVLFENKRKGWIHRDNTALI